MQAFKVSLFFDHPKSKHNGIFGHGIHPRRCTPIVSPIWSWDEFYVSPAFPCIVTRRVSAWWATGPTGGSLTCSVDPEGSEYFLSWAWSTMPKNWECKNSKGEVARNALLYRSLPTGVRFHCLDQHETRKHKTTDGKLRKIAGNIETMIPQGTHALFGTQLRQSTGWSWS